MAWAERVGQTSWRVRYFKDDGTIGSISGFPSKTAAEQHAADMESDQRSGTFLDPALGKTTVNEWVADWLPALDVDIRTEENYRSLLRRHILPRWGNTPWLTFPASAPQPGLKTCGRPALHHPPFPGSPSCSR